MNRKWKDTFPVNSPAMKYMRIRQHTMQIEEPFVILDNLETGTLRIYEHINGPLHVQQLISGKCNSKNTALIAEVIVNDLWKKDGVFIHRIFCEDGYEYLVQPLVYQILHFAGFYEPYQAVGILDREYDRWYPHAKEALSGFRKINRVYEYPLPVGGLNE